MFVCVNHTKQDIVKPSLVSNVIIVITPVSVNTSRQSTLPDQNPNNKLTFKPQAKNENDSAVTLATEMKTSVLLQTAKATVSSTDDQTKSIQARILFDSGS